jgi:hypothetical protein
MPPYTIAQDEIALLVERTNRHRTIPVAQAEQGSSAASNETSFRTTPRTTVLAFSQALRFF